MTHKNQLQSTLTLIFKTLNKPNLPPKKNNSTHSPIYPQTTFNSKPQQTPLNPALPSETNFTPIPFSILKPLSTPNLNRHL